MQHHPAAAIGLDGKATVLGYLAMIEKNGAAFPSIKLLVLCVTVAILCLGGIRPARADDPSAITGWQNFQFGMMYDDAAKQCDKNAQLTLSSVPQGGVGGQADLACKSVQILGVRFSVHLRFTLSGYLYEILLNSPSSDAQEYTTPSLYTVENALELKYGTDFDTFGDSNPPYKDDGTLVTTVKSWPSHYSAPTTLNDIPSSLGEGAIGDQEPPYILSSQLYEWQGGKLGGHGLLDIVYSASQNLYNQWVSQPTIFQSPAGGQL